MSDELILIVDDNEKNVKLARDVLRFAGFRTLEAGTAGEGVSLDDFCAFMEMHAYIFTPSGAMWPASSVNSRIPPIPLVNKNREPLLDDEGKQRKISAAASIGSPVASCPLPFALGAGFFCSRAT